MALAAMTACALVSCGGDDDDSPKSPGEPMAFEPTTITVTKNGKVASFMMMPVEAGTFTMGATPEQENSIDRERPTHSVTLTKNYFMGETEVTQELWETVMGSNPSNFKGANLPVEMVSWDDCQRFIKKLNRLTGMKFRLPTEAEWEFAARGGNKSKHYQYSGSKTLGAVAWCHDNSDGKTHPVKTKAANELGIYDMSGNVWEWCQDRAGDYSSEPVTNPTGPSTGVNRVLRGGAWNTHADFSHISYRLFYESYPTFIYGFRLAI